MAGDWIKVEKATARKPEVMRLASLLNIHFDHAYGLCFRFWCWCDENLSSGVIPGMTPEQLDSLMAHSGFASALATVEWLKVREGSLLIPNFNRHLSQGAKSRALAARRTAKSRANDVTKMSRSKRDTNVTREEKRREDTSPYPQELDQPKFRKAWTTFKDYRKQSGHGVLQPITEIENLTALAALGAEKAERIVRATVRKGWKHIAFDIEDGGRFERPQAREPTLPTAQEVRAKAEKEYQEALAKDGKSNAVT